MNPLLSIIDSEKTVIDVSGKYYRDLNHMLRALVSDGIIDIKLTGVCGQRYIAADLSHPAKIEINGTPGNDLGAFMDGSRISVYGNVQDACGNTMNSGELIVHGRAGDILGMSMRGGSIFVRDDIGYRGAIHMKEYGDKKPLLVVGGTSQDFFGEYMAGGTAILLGLTSVPHQARYIGTGMHGGTIYIRGQVQPYQIGREVGLQEPDESDMAIIEQAVERYSEHFGLSYDKIMSEPFIKLAPVSSRPYGRLYTY